MLVWAYGSNLSKKQMRARCPDAIKVGPLIVDDCRLVFRGVADVTYSPGDCTPGGLWDITEKDEQALDVFEGVAQGTYMKRIMPIRYKGRNRKVLFYQMRISRGVMPPSEEYVARIAQGYRDFGLDLADLSAAIERSWEDKDVTKRLAQRHRDRGSPRLAR